MPLEYGSRYALLGAMARQLAGAFASRGCPVNPNEPMGARPGLLLFFNALADPAAMHQRLLRAGPNLAVVQFHVDHPFALDEAQTDLFARLPNFRLVLPCLDGAHLLRLRWPSLAHAHCPHGVAPEALCDPASIARRHAGRAGGGDAADLILTGSIHTEGEIERMRERLPGAVRPAADEVAGLLIEHPAMPFEQALDLALAPRGTPPGQWKLAAAIWSVAVSAANRRRRAAIVRAMQGVRTVLYGGEAWREFASGTIEYRGDVAYDALPDALAGARVCLAWGPTQFAHTFSERLLLSMAAGCATVADDRLMIRRHFAHHPAPVAGDAHSRRDGAAVTLFDASGRDGPARARAAVDDLLRDASRREAMALAARGAIEAGHLWRHRTDAIAAVGSAALAA